MRLREVGPALALAGCGFHAELAPGYQCPTGDCPAGQVCADGVCVVPGDGGSIDAPAPGDGGLDPSLIAWWRFEDDPADGVYDATGHGHTGACSDPQCPLPTPGHLGSGYVFDGGDYIAVPGGGAFAAAGAVTIAGWERLDDMIDQTPLSKPLRQSGSADVNAWQFEVQPPAQGCLTGPDKVCTDGVIAWGTWQHFAATWDGARKRLFLDGSVVLDVPATLELDDSDVVIGADYHLDPTSGAPTGVFVQVVGALDEVQVYDRVLSDDEIAALATE